VTQVELHYPQIDQCGCGRFIDRQQAQASGRRQVHELPAIELDVIDHIQMAVRCVCGQVHEGTYPEQVTEAVQYGDRVKALAILLNQQHMVSVLRTQELLEDITGRTISTGTLVNWTQALAQQLSPWMGQLKQRLIQADRVHCDETGIRVEGKNAWVHTVATESYAIYHVHAKRGFEAVKALGILTELKPEAVCIHDCWSTYFRLDVNHALCNAHILRELTSIIQNDANQALWAQGLSDVLKETLHACHLAQAQSLTALPEDMRVSFIKRYDALVAQGLALNPENTTRPEGFRGKLKQTTEFNLLSRLKDYACYILRFATDFTVPFTNNLAEQTLRMIKVKMKVSGTFRSITGAEHFATIRSYTETMRKQGLNLFDAITRAFARDPQPLPSR
jgi:transposase